MKEANLELAEEINQANIDAAVRKARKSLKKAPKPNGKCLYCDAPLKPHERFCDVDCRDDFEKYCN